MRLERMARRVSELKKIFFVIVCTMLLLGIASYAMAATEVTIGGDVRVRGIWKWDWDFDNSNETIASGTSRNWDQRMRVKIDAKVDKVEAHTRMTVSEGVWGQSATYGGVSLHDDDYAYLVVPVGPVTITAGRQLADWGNKFLVWNAGVDRFKMIYKVDDTLTTGLFLDKSVEKSDYTLAGDTNKYVVPVIYKSGDLTAGFLYILTHTSSMHKEAGDVVGSRGMTYDAYFMKAGDNTFAGEFVYANGAAVAEKAGSDITGAKFGGFLVAFIKADATTFKIATAYTRNGLTASKYFTPTLFFGTSQPTGMIDFGACAMQSAGGDGCNSLAFVLGAENKIDDASTAGVKLAWARIANDLYNINGHTDSYQALHFWELDLAYKYKISDAAEWVWEYGYLKPTNMTSKNPANNAVDEAAQVLVQRIEVKF
jgi:hypothetical protein